MDMILAILLLFLMVAVYLLITNWWIVVVAAGVIVLVGGIVLIVSLCDLQHLKKDVVSTEIISKEPIVERIAENTGYSIGYGRHLSSRRYYRYRDVITGYKVKFNVFFKDGGCKVIECDEGSEKYNILFARLKTLTINENTWYNL